MVDGLTSSCGHNRHNLNRLTCDLCPETFGERKKLTVHKALVHKIGELKTYKCHLCKHRTIHAKAFKDHVANHKKVRPYRCETCEKTFASEYLKNQHNIRVHSRVQYKCLMCQSEFKSPGSLRIHQKRDPQQCDICNIQLCSLFKKVNHYKSAHLDEMLFKCGFCQQEFAKLFDMNEHMSTEHAKNDDETNFLKCDHCDYKTFGKFGKAKLRMHNLQHKEKPYLCKVCGKRYVSNSKLEVHQKSVHLGLKEFHCKECDQTFVQKGSIKRHIEQVHNNSKKNIRPYHCDICEKTFTTKGGRNEHKKSAHEKKEPISCEYCGKHLSGKSTLRDHKLLYHLDKVKDCELYYCNACDFKTANKLTLKNHGYRHLDKIEKPHACENCDLRFVQNAQLQRHIKAVHLGIKEFKCEQCDSQYFQNANLQRHIKAVHLGIKEFKCKHCESSFAYPASLKTHVKRRHDHK